MTSLRVVGETVVDDDEEPSFGAFWLLYPRRVARLAAERAWKKLSCTEQVEALTALVPWRKYWIRRGEMEFTPYPASWLNGHRWEDELPDQWASTAASSSHLPYTPKESGPRTMMPQHVKDALAKLRK